MNAPDRSTGQWQVHLPAAGEILAATAADAAIQLGLLGIPEGYSAPEIEGWLNDLIGVARETGREDTQPRPIPALLHHGLTGLLFSHAQLWNREGERPPLSFAVVRAEGGIGFGWIGDAAVRVTCGGAAIEPGEIIVRDDEGREARAIALDDANVLDIELIWPGAHAGGGAATLTAHWQPAAPTAEPPAPEVRAVPDAEPSEAAPPQLDETAETETETETAETETSFLDAAGTPFDFGNAGPSAPVAGLERETAFEFEEPAPPAHPARTSLPETGAPADRPDWLTPSTVSGWDSAQDGTAAGEADAVEDAPFATPDRSLDVPAPWEDIEDDAGAPGTAAAHDVVPAPRSAPRPLHGAPPATAALEPDRVDPARIETPVQPVASLDPAAAPAGNAAADVEQRVHAPLEQMSMDVQETATALEAPVDAAPAYGLEDEPAAPPAHRPSRLRRLFSRLAFWKGREVAEEVQDAAVGLPEEPELLAHDVAGVPDQVPPSPEAGEITERAVTDYVPAEGSIDPADVLEEEPGPRAVIEARDTPRTAGIEDAAPHAAPQAGAMPAPAIVQKPAAPAPVTNAPAAAAARVAHAPAGRARVPMRPEWPSEAEMHAPVPLWKRPWVWAAVMVALFAGGWIVGHMNEDRRTAAGRGVRDALRAVGLGGAHFDVMVNSRPQGAWIAVNGEDIARRTPASVELEPGEHEITLSFSDLGAATFTVRGVDGESIAMDPPLWGSLSVYSSDAEVPVAVTVDGVTRGFAPLRVDSLTPGAHDVRFSGPGLPSWGQTVQVRVGEGAELIARPMTSPAMGVIEVRASLATESGTVDVEGARVFLDSEAVGVTPLTLELPRGPHSVRVEHQGESSQVQLIDLPGGNQRFASFQLQPGAVRPGLQPLDPPAEVPLDRPTVVSVGLEGVQSTDVREMWLHVQTPDGPWRRYEMAWLKAPGSVVGVAVFPTTLFDSDGRVSWYASASTRAGDEYFSELQRTARPGAAAPRRGR